MSKSITIHKIGNIYEDNYRYILKLSPQYADGLEELSGFSHIQVMWWEHRSDDANSRTNTLIENPYKNGSKQIGVFATRSEVRPNPILLTLCNIINVDVEKGEVEVSWIDAEDEAEILDIKPYIHCSDFPKTAKTAIWCENWPQNLESSASFDWQSEFNF